MTVRIKKYILYLVLWGFIATMLLISNTIGYALSGTSPDITAIAFYHFLASPLWIPVAMLLARFYSGPGRNSVKWLFVGFSFFPGVLAVDTLYRSFLRYQILDIPFTGENLLVVFKTLVDANLLIFGCVSLFMFISVNMVNRETRELERAKESMSLNEDEMDRVLSSIPPGFLSRNLERILKTYELSYERGEELIVTFSDFLRLIIYRRDHPAECRGSDTYAEQLICSYELYLSAYLSGEIRVAAKDIGEIFQIDQKIEQNEEKLVP